MLAPSAKHREVFAGEGVFGHFSRADQHHAAENADACMFDVRGMVRERCLGTGDSLFLLILEQINTKLSYGEDVDTCGMSVGISFAFSLSGRGGVLCVRKQDNTMLHCGGRKTCTPQTDDLCDLHDLYDLFQLHDLDLPGKADRLSILCDLAHVAGWEPYNLHDLARVSWVGLVHYTDAAQQALTTAGEELDDIDHELSDLSDLSVRGVQD